MEVVEVVEVAVEVVVGAVSSDSNFLDGTLILAATEPEKSFRRKSLNSFQVS